MEKYIKKINSNSDIIDVFYCSFYGNKTLAFTVVFDKKENIVACNSLIKYEFPTMQTYFAAENEITKDEFNAAFKKLITFLNIL